MLITDGNGLPIAKVLASAQVYEVRLAEETLRGIHVPRRTGRSKTRPRRLVADKGYDSDAFRRALRRRGIGSSIPYKANATRRRRWTPIAREDYRERWHIERTFSWLQNFRRLLVRHEGLLSVYDGFFTLGCVLICLGAILK